MNGAILPKIAAAHKSLGNYREICEKIAARFDLLFERSTAAKLQTLASDPQFLSRVNEKLEATQSPFTVRTSPGPKFQLGEFIGKGIAPPQGQTAASYRLICNPPLPKA